jgi:hypothetical protein
MQFARGTVDRAREGVWAPNHPHRIHVNIHSKQHPLHSSAGFGLIVVVDVAAAVVDVAAAVVDVAAVVVERCYPRVYFLIGAHCVTIVTNHP